MPLRQGFVVDDVEGAVRALQRCDDGSGGVSEVNRRNVSITRTRNEADVVSCERKDLLTVGGTAPVENSEPQDDRAATSVRESLSVGLASVISVGDWIALDGMAFMDPLVGVVGVDHRHGLLNQFRDASAKARVNDRG